MIKVHVFSAIVLLLASAGCKKPEDKRVEVIAPPEPPRPASAPSPSFALSTAPSPSTATVPSASPSSAAIAPSRAVASARPRETGAPPSVASASPSAAPAPARAPVLPPVLFQRSSDHYLLDATRATSCAANVPCEVSVRLEGRAGFHINKEYPYKLEAQPTPGVVFANASGTFSRQSGDFTEQSENVAVMRVRFTANAPGRAAIRGVYNMSVCSASKCDLEKVPIAFEAPIR